MNKPKLKADWKVFALKLKVTVEDADTTKEIKKNIADKLSVSSRGANFDKRLIAAMENALFPKDKVKVPPSTKKADTLPSVKNGHIKLKFTKVVHERKDDVCLQFKGGEVWLNKHQIEMVSDSEVIMPDWLAELKKI